MTTLLGPQPLEEEVLRPARALRARLRSSRPVRRLVGSSSFVPQVAVVICVTSVVAVLTSAPPVWSALAAAQLLAVIALTSRSALRPGMLDPTAVLRAVPLVLAGPPACATLAGAPPAGQWRVVGVAVAGLVALGLTELVIRWASGPPRVLIVAEPAVAAAVAASWARRGDLVVVDTIGPDGIHGPAGGPGTGGPSFLGRVADAAAELVLVVPGGGIDCDTFERLCWDLERSPARLAVLDLGLERVGAHRVRATRLGDSTLAALAHSRASGPARVVKALADRVLAAVLLVVLSPLLAFLVVLVRLDSPGPAIFRQQRAGRDGVPFTMLKLRTMHVGTEDPRELGLEADGRNGVLFKMRCDPRVTRVGATLRALSLDELPQLVNVLRGEMSLVGPRPALPSEVAVYDERARRRLAVRPGLTGLWQVRGRADLDWDESIALDLHYTDNITLGRDLVICAATVRAVLSRRGAY